METCLFLLMLSAFGFPLLQPSRVLLHMSPLIGQLDSASDQALIGDWKGKVSPVGAFPSEFTLKVRSNSGIVEATMEASGPITVPVTNLDLSGSQVSFEWAKIKFKGIVQGNGHMSGTVWLIGGSTAPAEWTRVETAAQVAAASSATAYGEAPIRMSGAQSSKLIISAPMPNPSGAVYLRTFGIIRLEFTVLPDGTTKDIADLDATSHQRNSIVERVLVGPSIDVSSHGATSPTALMASWQQFELQCSSNSAPMSLTWSAQFTNERDFATGFVRVKELHATVSDAPRNCPKT